MIIIAGTIDLEDHSRLEEAMTRAIPLQKATRDDEPGCLAYVFNPDPCTPGTTSIWAVCCARSVWPAQTTINTGSMPLSRFTMRQELPGLTFLALADY